MASTGVVLLCAEDDDLELVRWVHAARMQGLAPEVVAGIERDDAPLLTALEQTEDALFVVLRSDNLGPERMREIKGNFARHRRVGQRLVALRLDGSPDAAIERIAVEINGGLRARSESSLTAALESFAIGDEPRRPADRIRGPNSGRAQPLANLARESDSVPIPQPSEPTPVPMVIDPAALAGVPSVEHALAFSKQALEQETTGVYQAEDDTQPTLPNPPSIVDPASLARRQPRRSRWPALLVAGASVAGCAGVGAWLFLVTTGEPAERATTDSPGTAPRVSRPNASATDTRPSAPNVARVPNVPKVSEPTPSDSPVANDLPVAQASLPTSDGSETERSPGSRRPRTKRIRESETAQSTPTERGDAEFPNEPAPLDPPSE